MHSRILEGEYKQIRITEESQVGLVPGVGLSSLSPKYAEAANPNEVASEPSASG